MVAARAYKYLVVGNLGGDPNALQEYQLDTLLPAYLFGIIYPTRELSGRSKTGADLLITALTRAVCRKYSVAYCTKFSTPDKGPLLQ